MSRSSWVVVAGLAGAVALVMPAQAVACVGLGCRDPWQVAPADGGAIPANAPALALTSTGAPAVPFRADGGSGADVGVSLLLPDGGALALTVVPDDQTLLLLRPATPLPEGQTLRLRFPALCGGADAGAAPVEATLRTLPASPLPTSLGTLVVVSQGSGSIPVSDGATCSTTLTGAWAQLALQVPPEVEPWLPLMRWTLLVDGAAWATEPPGALLRSGRLAAAPQVPSQFRVSRRVLQVHGACASGEASLDRGVGLGSHAVTLQGAVLGSGVALAASATILLSCTGPSQPPVPVEEGTPSVLPLPASCGCTSGGSGLGALLGAAAVLLRRRRPAQGLRNAQVPPREAPERRPHEAEDDGHREALVLARRPRQSSPRS